MSRILLRIRALRRYCAYGPEYDATAQDGLGLSPARLFFIAFFFLAILPSLGWGTAASWGGAMVGVELYLNRILRRQIVAGTRTTRRCRIVGSLAASAGWVGIAGACWVSPDHNLRLAALSVWTGMFLYAQASCSKFPAHFILTGVPPILAIIVAPLTASDISIQARITIEGAVILSLVHTVNSALTTYRRHSALEQASAAAESASQAKSDFLAMMSHELRTPLNGVLGLAHALAQTNLTAKQTQFLQGITRSGDGLMSILNDILDMTKIEAGRMEISASATDVHALADDVRALFEPAAAAKSLSLSLSVEVGTAQWISVDALRLKQVLSNLVSNALKFTEMGEVRISLRAEDGSGGPVLLLRVDDTGPGLTETARARLFERFSQGHAGIARSFGGTGLGLAISRDLARAMGGDLRLLDRPGSGASFELAVPLKACPAAAPAFVAEDTARPVGKVENLSILVVEDNPVNRAVVQALLEPTGWRLVFAENGALGLEALSTDLFDLVLMDIHMPVMDGLKAVAEIRAGKVATREVPVIALTADAMSGSGEKLLAAGFDGYVEKPIRPHVLLGAIHAVLDASAQQSPIAEAMAG